MYYNFWILLSIVSALTPLSLQSVNDIRVPVPQYNGQSVILVPYDPRNVFREKIVIRSKGYGSESEGVGYGAPAAQPFRINVYPPGYSDGVVYEGDVGGGYRVYGGVGYGSGGSSGYGDVGYREGGDYSGGSYGGVRSEGYGGSKGGRHWGFGGDGYGDSGGYRGFSVGGYEGLRGYEDFSGGGYGGFRGGEYGSSGRYEGSGDFRGFSGGRYGRSGVYGGSSDGEYDGSSDGGYENINPSDVKSNNCNTCVTATCVREAARLIESIDESVSPCDDFYTFSCGKWIESTKLPSDKSSYDRFTELSDKLNEKLTGLLEKISLETEKRDFVITTKKYYESCMNTTLIEKLGDKPLVDLLTKLGEWPLTLKNKLTEIEWTNLFIRLRELGLNNDMLFSLTVDTDIRNNSRRILSLDQPSFGLKSRDIMLRGVNDSTVTAYRNIFIGSAIKLGALNNFVNQTVDDVLRFETLLANLSMPKEERRDFDLIYNKMTIKELQNISSNIDWFNIFKKYVSDSITEDDEVLIYDLPYIRSLDLLLKKTKNRLLVNYIIWRVVFEKISKLSSDWDKLVNEYNVVVYGIKTSSPRSENCLKSVASSLPIALSNLYVKNFFDEENKEKSLEIISNIKKEFKNTLNTNEWMRRKTLKHALRKLKKMKLLVGYPQELIDDEKISEHYKMLDLSSTDYFGNQQNLIKWNSDLIFKELHEPNDKYDWRELSSVAKVNAYYHWSKNLVIILAGILDGVFYNKDRPNYLNYGAIGLVAGHEVIHGFDDKGRQFDEDANAKNWWDESTDREYRSKAQCFIDEYSNYTVEEIGLKVNGINTQGENIADNGGIKLSFRAYLNYIQSTGPESQLPGLKYTPEQLFWISSAIHFCTKQTDEFLKDAIQTDPHTPAKQRVNGRISNSKDFSTSFKCSIGSPMNPKEKCSVW